MFIKDNPLTVLFKRLSSDPAWPMPSYATPGSVLLDLAADIHAPIALAPGQIKLIPSGWAIALPVGYEAQIRPRSGNALKRGLTFVTCIGTIDSDYRGELGLAMINLGPEVLTINRGDRLGQMIFNKIERPALVLAEALDDTDRGAGGFGSTGL
jgi:dUTP pyrophosphatase